ncbi:MAG: transposase [bacterium]|nr:transposase [bacterium]MDD7751804.1 transposase [bacterium]
MSCKLSERKQTEVELKKTRFRTLPFETQIIKRYQTKQSRAEEALIEMYLAGVFVRRLEDIGECSTLSPGNFGK